MAKTTTPTIPQTPNLPKVKTPKHRSPNYPAIGLRRALERAKDLYDVYKRGQIPLMVALQKWNFKQALGVAAQTIAALKAYGLLEVEGDTNKRTVKVSERAQMILGGHPDKIKLLRQAALDPVIFKEMWEKQNTGTETDEAMKTYLHWDRNFNPESIDGLIADFRDTISFAELVADGRIDDVGGSSAHRVTPKIGDLVQWTSNGVMQFQTPRRLAGFSEDGLWVFVEGNPTGVLLSEVSVVEKASTGSTNMQAPFAPTLSPPLAPVQKGAKQDTFNIDEGAVVLQYPATLSQSSFHDLEDWIKLQLRKIARSITKPASGDGSENN